MMNRDRVSVLGCGWFGFPLAKELIQTGYKVKGSTTTTDKLAELQSAGIEPYLLNLSDQDLGAGAFFESDVLILGVPPKMRSGNEDNYAEKISRVVEHLKASTVKQVIFISSTSVFSDVNAIVDENAVPDPETPSGTAIYAAETYLRSCSNFNTTIVRFSGLIGPGRNPGRFFAGKSNIPNGQAPVNLIHLDDCVGILVAILERKAFGYIFHAVAPEHPQKSLFYRKAALESGLEAPEFVDQLQNWKIISSHNVSRVLNYEFKESIMA